MLEKRNVVAGLPPVDSFHFYLVSEPLVTCLRFNRDLVLNLLSVYHRSPHNEVEPGRYFALSEQRLAFVDLHSFYVV